MDDDRTPTVARPRLTARGRVLLPTWQDSPVLRIGAVVVTVAILAAAATVLARAAHDQRVVRGGRAAELGNAELREARIPAAVEHLRAAVALEPDVIPYRVSLAKALVALEQTGEAQTYLLDVLRQDPVHGDANLTLARLLRAAGKPEEAEAAYYRAIYGRWGANEQDRRVQARLELVALFLQTSDRGRVRAALIELASAFPGDRTLQLRAGRQLLDLGFAEEAARLFQGVTDRFAAPGTAFADLAEAELARGRFAAAFEAARRAVALAPRDLASLSRRDVSARILTLDPDQPRLSAAERARRTRRLLTLARERLVACRGPRGIDPDQRALLALVDGVVKERRRQPDEVGPALLDAMAAQTVAACPASDPTDAAGLLLGHIARATRR